MSGKRRPSHSLKSIKEAAGSKGQLDIRRRPLDDAYELGYSLDEIIEVIAELGSSNFKKTMESDDFEGEMIDVYTFTDQGFDLYLEFSQWPDGKFKLIAFHLE